jgi:hypothetical protein
MPRLDEVDLVPIKRAIAELEKRLRNDRETCHNPGTLRKPENVA